MSAGTLLVVAKLPPERRRILEVMANAAGLDLHVIQDSKVAASWAARNEPRAILLDAKLAAAQELCHRVRGQRGLAKVAMIALAFEQDDLQTEQYYSWGVDDVVPAEIGAPLIDRLSRIVEAGRVSPTTRRGRAVVADPDRGRCDVVGRVLHNAGYEVACAADERKLMADLMQRAATLVVASAAVGAPRELIQSARRAGSQACWVVTSPRREIDGHLKALTDIDGVAVVGAFGPVENILFLSNEMLSGCTEAVRRTARMLYGSVVRFRPSGEQDDDSGYTYNISAGGMYVRTLAPPAGNQLWLELRPPYQKHRVRFLARVVWRRAFGDNALATVPAGFGVELVDSLGDGLELWHRGLQSLLATTGTTGRVADPEERHLIGRVASLPVGMPALPTGSQARAIVEGEPSTLRGLSCPPPPLPEPESAAPSLRASEHAMSERPEDGAASGAAADSDDQPGDGAAAARIESALQDDRAERKPRSPWALIAMAGMVMAGALVGGYRALRSNSQGEPSRPASASSSKHRTGKARVAALPTGLKAVAAPSSAQPALAITAAEKVSRPDAGASQLGGESPDSGGAEQGPPDPARLSAREAYLLVGYPDQGRVYLNGVDAGATGEWLTVKCGTWYVRVGTADKVPRWLTEGQSAVVSCMRSTRVTLRPSP